MKTCNHCGLPKPLTDYSPARRNKDGRVNRCKVCMNEYWTKRYHRVKVIASEFFNVDKEMKWLIDPVQPERISVDEYFENIKFKRTA